MGKGQGTCDFDLGVEDLSSDDECLQEPLYEGCNVRVMGLASEAGMKLNGQRGKAVRFDQSRGRWEVDLRKGAPLKALKSINLEVVEVKSKQQKKKEKKQQPAAVAVEGNVQDEPKASAFALLSDDEGYLSNQSDDEDEGEEDETSLKTKKLNRKQQQRQQDAADLAFLTAEAERTKLAAAALSAEEAAATIARLEKEIASTPELMTEAQATLQPDELAELIAHVSTKQSSEHSETAKVGHLFGFAEAHKSKHLSQHQGGHGAIADYRMQGGNTNGKVSHNGSAAGAHTAGDKKRIKP